jgi:hypothetical protein
LRIGPLLERMGRKTGWSAMKPITLPKRLMSLCDAPHMTVAAVNVNKRRAAHVGAATKFDPSRPGTVRFSFR